MNWYLKVLKQYADFNGRARRKEYWMFALFSAIIQYAIMGIGLATGITALGFVSTAYSFAVLLPSIAVGVRRMHDIGKSGWYLLIPFYNIYLLCVNGDQGSNEYGVDPKNPTDELDEIGTAQA